MPDMFTTPTFFIFVQKNQSVFAWFRTFIEMLISLMLMIIYYIKYYPEKRLEIFFIAIFYSVLSLFYIPGVDVQIFYVFFGIVPF
jgi:hypothetical protein